ncbi:MAG: DNA adenine methylase, partial [Bacilli bacterium]
MFNIQNRRYTGNKFKLMKWIEELIDTNCLNCTSFFDVFSGTGSVTNFLISKYKRYVMNDFLFSNEIVYKGFFLQEEYDLDKLKEYVHKYNNINQLIDNYVSINYGNKYFSDNDAKKIGIIRQNIEDEYTSNKINYKEYTILLSSLIYSLDKISNTVGHYEAYIKGKDLKDLLVFDLIKPKTLKKNQEVEICREDSNKLAKRIKTDIAFIDPPYNSRQYSRFYHVLETIVKWDKPNLYGTAMKPEIENMSDYCRSSAVVAFRDLIENLNVKYIVVTYNNTYTSKSSSSQNKISLEQIKEILLKKGKTKVYEKPYKAFTTGKTELLDHKEYVFITEVEHNEKSNEKVIRSPFFYVGDKYKLMGQLKELFPENINNYIEPFVGGGSSFLNTSAKKYILNDLNSYIIKLHDQMIKYSNDSDRLFNDLYNMMDKYGLSCSYRNINVPKDLKEKYKKTYY